MIPVRSPDRFVILIAQQGFETALVRLGHLGPDRVVDFFSHRRHRLRLVLNILRCCLIMAGAQLRRRHPMLIVSSQEGDEPLGIVWFLSRLLGLRATFVLLGINRREDGFTPIASDQVSLPRHTARLIAQLNRQDPGSVSYILNDLRQPAFFLNLPISERIDLPRDACERLDDARPETLYLLLEPERSRDLLDHARWSTAMIRIADEARAINPDVAIRLKAHPYQACVDLDVTSAERLPASENIFARLRASDWVAGTFGNVIDIGPMLCRTISVFPGAATVPPDDPVMRRVLLSGAELR